MRASNELYDEMCEKENDDAPFLASLGALAACTCASKMCADSACTVSRIYEERRVVFCGDACAGNHCVVMI